MERITTQRDSPGSLRARLVRLLLGGLALGLMIAFFMSGITLPGAAGEVLRHNRELGIDASPLFYSEVEHMSSLESGVRQLREGALRRDSAAVELDSAPLD